MPVLGTPTIVSHLLFLCACTFSVGLFRILRFAFFGNVSIIINFLLIKSFTTSTRISVRQCEFILFDRCEIEVVIYILFNSNASGIFVALPAAQGSL